MYGCLLLTNIHPNFRINISNKDKTFILYFPPYFRFLIQPWALYTYKEINKLRTEQQLKTTYISKQISSIENCRLVGKGESVVQYRLVYWIRLTWLQVLVRCDEGVVHLRNSARLGRWLRVRTQPEYAQQLKLMTN